jgi:hypothetical protein
MNSPRLSPHNCHLSKTLAVVAILLNRDGSAGVDICTRLASSEIDVGPPLQTKEFPQPSEMNINKTVDTPVRIRYRAALHLLAAAASVRGCSRDE